MVKVIMVFVVTWWWISGFTITSCNILELDQKMLEYLDEIKLYRKQKSSPYTKLSLYITSQVVVQGGALFKILTS